MTTVSAAILLLLVIDPMGNVPLFVVFLANVAPDRIRRVVMRELCIALAVLVFFLFAGHAILQALHITGPALTIAGGVVLFLIAIKMIFASAKDIFPQNPEGEPWIVPLAIPFVAGPSAVATVLLLMAREPARWLDWLIALVAAWLIAGTILLFSTELNRWLGERGLNAVERLMGLLLTTVAIQMFLSGIADFLASLPS